jgi:hypothetical protein
LVVVTLNLDFSRTLNAKERRAFGSRAGRLSGPFGASAAAATSKMNKEFPLGGPLRVRTWFVALDQPVNADEVSDRSAPDRRLRPSATRISSSQGATLRLYLTALAVAQAITKPGKRAHLPDMPIAEFGGEKTGWTDLVATGAVVSGKGATASMVRDKKARSVRTSLDTLSDAMLVQLTGPEGRRGRHGGFMLLHEGGAQLDGDAHPYSVPAADDASVFELPPGFITNGWVHVLEDSEIAVLLMVASGHGSLYAGNNEAFDLQPGEVAIPAWARLRHFGIHRDPFSTARKTLEWFGLLDVREVRRHDDGRAENDDERLHRLTLNTDGFGVPALEQVRQVIAAQLDRTALT